MFNNEIDFESFFTKGYAVTKINDITANAILNQLKEEAWVEVQPDYTTLANSHEKHYQSRFIAAQSLLQPQNLRPTYNHLLESLIAYAADIISPYGLSDSHSLSAFCGRKGYSMGLHSDAGDRSVFNVIGYFGDAALSESDGGYLEFYEVDLLDPSEEKAKLIKRVHPENGLLVLLNTKNPMFYHKVVGLRQDINRYQLFGNICMENPPDWHYEYTESKGFINEGNPKSIDDFESIVDLLNNRAL